MKLLTLILLLAAPAWGRTYQINLIQSHGPREVSRQDAIEMLTIARAKLAQAGIKTRVGRVSYSRLLNPSYTLLTYGQGAFWWAKKLPPRLNIIRHVLTPPFYDEERYWMAGVSIGICLVHYRYAITTSNAQLTNIDGLDRFYHSAISIAHELGHAFGAKHTLTPSIMSSDALYFSPVWALQFATGSIRQMKACTS